WPAHRRPAQYQSLFRLRARPGVSRRQAGTQAVAEFQKILDHRGVVLNGLVSALAHLGLARAYALSCDVAKSRVAYQDRPALWRGADPNIPLLQQARSESASPNSWGFRCDVTPVSTGWLRIFRVIRLA